MDADERSRYAPDKSGWKKLDIEEYGEPIQGQIYWRTIGHDLKIMLCYGGTEGEAIIAGATSMTVLQQRSQFRTKVRELVIQFKQAGVYGIIEPERRFKRLPIPSKQQLMHEARLRRRAKRDAEQQAIIDRIAAEQKMKADQEAAARAEYKAKRLASIAAKQESKLLGGPKWHEKLWQTESKASRVLTEES